MRLEIERQRILIIPETPQDEAMLEEVFELRKHGDMIHCVRRNAMNLDCWAYVEIATPRPSPP